MPPSPLSIPLSLQLGHSQLIPTSIQTGMVSPSQNKTSLLSLLSSPATARFSVSTYNKIPSKMPSHLLFPLSLKPIPVSLVENKDLEGPSALEALQQPQTAHFFILMREKRGVCLIEAPIICVFVSLCSCVAGLHQRESCGCWVESELLPRRFALKRLYILYMHKTILFL